MLNIGRVVATIFVVKACLEQVNMGQSKIVKLGLIVNVVAFNRQ